MAAIAVFDTKDKPVRVLAPTASCKYYRITWYEPGNPKQLGTSMGIIEADALEWAKTQAQSLKRIQATPKAERKFATLGEVLDRYLDAKNQPGWGAARTEETAGEQYTRYITDEFRAIPAHRATKADFQKLLDDAKRADEADDRPFAKSTLTDGRAFLSALQTFGIEECYFESGQFPGSLRLPRSLDEMVDDGVVFGEDDEDDAEFTVNKVQLPLWQRVFEMSKAMPTETFALMVLFAAVTGMRFGELVALRWSDINTKTRQVSIVNKVSETNRGVQRAELPKGRKRRKTAYPAWLADRVEARVEAARLEQIEKIADAEFAGDEAELLQTGLMFPSPSGTWLRRSNFHSRVWQTARGQAGWKQGWTFHTLRHIAAVHMIFDLHCELLDVAEALGHADVGVTQRVYLQAREGSTERVAANMASTAVPWETAYQVRPTPEVAVAVDGPSPTGFSLQR
jgi:integrase